MDAAIVCNGNRIKEGFHFRIGLDHFPYYFRVNDGICQRAGRGVCRAVLKGSPLRAELVLFVAKSHEVTSKWLESVGTAG